MTEMAKQYLEQILTLDGMIQNKLDEIFRLRSSIIMPSCQKNGDKVQTSVPSDRMADAISVIIGLEREYDVLICRYNDLRRDIFQKLSMMSYDKYRQILKMKYVDGKSIRRIAYELKMTERGCKKAHKRALEEFYIIMEKCKIGIDNSLYPHV